MRLSQKYADHSAVLSAIANYITAGDGSPSDNAIRLGISAAEIGNIGNLRAAFEGAYSAYINLNTHNAISVAAMRIADENAFAVILPLRQRLKYGRAKLTPEDYANLGIHEDKKTETHAKTPTDVPTLLLVKSEPMHLTFEATEQTPQGANRAALPRRWRVAREIAVVAQGTTPTERDFYSIEESTHSRFAIVFSAAEIGMNVYLRIAYENSAGRGPFSLPMKAIVV